MKKFQFPTPYTVLFAVIIVAAVATWLLPAGSYNTLRYDSGSDQFEVHTLTEIDSKEATQTTLDKLGVSIPIEKFKEGKIKKPISIPNTYQQTEPTPQGILEIIYAPLKGMYEVIDIILLVLIIGGFIGVFNSSGSFDLGIGYLAYKLKGRESLLIVFVVLSIALGGSTFGMQEETLAFYPLLVPVFLAAGYDLIVPVAVIYIASCIGTMGGTINPFGTIIASDAVGINWTLGFSSRVIMWIAGSAITIAYVIRYAAKVKADPTKSLLYDTGIKSPFEVVENEVKVIDFRTKLLLVLFASTFAIMIYGVAFLEWWFLEMTALFLVSSIIVGVIQRIGERNFVNSFIGGAKDLLGVSMIIGIARGVTIILNEGKISDTILFYAANAIQGTSGYVFLPAVMLVFIVLTLFISSSSGMAVVTMPILGSLGQVIGVPQEEVVNAYLFGFGLMSIITPTGIALPSLAMVNVGYDKWLKFVWPLMVMLAITSVLILWAGLWF